MDDSLTGIWTFHLETPWPHDPILQIFPDDRLVLFYRQAADPSSRVAANTLRATLETGSTYRIRITADVPGYTITMSREGDALLIENKGQLFRHRRLQAHELPPWYEEKLASAVWR